MDRSFNHNPFRKETVMIDFSMHVSALVLEQELASTTENRILVLKESRSGAYMLPTEDLSSDESEIETLDRALREMCSMRLTVKLGKVGRRLVKTNGDKVSTTEAFLCQADGTPEYFKGGFEALWVEPHVLLKTPQMSSERFSIIFRNVAALCTPPFREAKHYDVRKLSDCCRTIVSSSAGTRRSQDIIPCGQGHLVQCDEVLRVWIIPQPQATVETVRV